MPAWSHPAKRVRFDKILGGTPASANMAAAHKGMNSDFIVLAQGHHHPTYNRMSKRLRQVFSYRSKPHPVYHGHPGGPEDTRRSLAGWLNRFFDIPATSEKTFLLQQQARFALKALFESISGMQDKKGKYVLMPNLRWKLLDSLIKPFGLKIKDYDVTDPDIAGAIARAVKECGGPENVAAISLNAPGNPTGRHYAAEDYKAIMRYVNFLNANLPAGSPKIVLVHDDPYVGCVKVRKRPGDKLSGPFLNTGYEGSISEWETLDTPDGKEPLTPEAYVHSLSKLTEEAANGRASVYITSAMLAKIYGKTLINSGSLAYSNDMMVKSIAAFGGDYDDDFIERCEQTVSMVETNDETLRKRFGGRVMPGGVNITQLVKIPKIEILGREVDGHDCGRIVLADVCDAVEEIANKGGVGLVPQLFDRQRHKPVGFDPKNDLLIRFVLASPPREFAKGVGRAGDTLDEIRELPVLAA